MSLLNNSNAISTGGGYNLENSLRLRSSASAYLSRTPATAGNRKTWTWSGWVKRGALGGIGELLGSDGATNNTNFAIELNGDTVYIGVYGFVVLQSTAVFRDPSAWYHLVVAFDSTQATAANRVKVYINGVEITSWSTDARASITLNGDYGINNTAIHNIGRNPVLAARYFDGYLTEVNLIDGQALTPSDFGETNSDTGVWQPIKYTGTYGTNGFYLPFKPTTQATGFNTVLYTGNGTSQDITGVGFEPDLVWIKGRSVASGVITGHSILDTIRGASNELSSNTTNAEGALNNSLFGDMTSFNSNGFTVIDGSDTNYDTYNGSQDKYVAWCWDAGSGSPVSNTDGTITSTVKANPATGFSVMTYTGSGVAGSVGHGLGVVPKLYIIKQRTDAGNNWIVQTTAVDGSLDYLFLNANNAKGDSGDALPTSSVLNISGNNDVNGSGDGIVAYCFSDVAGYQKIGSYTGNGSTTGPVVTTGFRPRFVLVKKTSGAEGWYLADTARSPSNTSQATLSPDTSNAENTTAGGAIDFLDTGFQPRNGAGQFNDSGATYIYLAIADTTDAQFNFDASGNKNNWTANNINSNASGDTTYDIMTDVPTLTDEDTANYAVLNPLSAGTNANISQGNLYAVGNAVNHVGVYPTILPKTGKWYFEFDIVTANSGGFGFSNSPGPISGFPGLASGYWYIYGALTTGYSIHNELTYTSYTDTRFNTGNLGQMAIDFDTGKVWVGSNNVWINSTNGTTGNPSTGANPTWTMPTGVQYYPFMEFANPATTFAMNFGQRPLAYTPPTGYLKLNTFNLPDSSIIDGSEYMNTVLYTGNSTARSITGVGFSPDLVWAKGRSAAYKNSLFDSVRGTTKLLSSDRTDAELTVSGVTSFDADGFSLGTNNDPNANGVTWAAWNWRGSDSAAVSNTDGTITSQVSANPTAGFSVVTYTGTGSAATVGHGLGVAPSMVIVKWRSSAGGSWATWHSSFVTASNTDYLLLDSNGAKGFAGSLLFWNNTIPTSSVFSIGTNAGLNTNTGTYVAYCFADVEGYSKFGSYTGNGSTDGTFVYTGFRPAYIMIKGTSTSSWVIIDNKRNGYNVVEPYVLADSPNAESSTYTVADFLSNGFKMRSTAVHNASGQTWIYMAFAENPFKNSLAR